MYLPDTLSSLLRRLSPLVIAFSGGLDSRFLAHAASLTDGVAFTLYHIKGPHVPGAESDAAVAWAQERGFALTLLTLDPLDIPEVRRNGKERCYFCKRHLFTSLCRQVDTGEESGPGRAVCDGSNLSDMGLYRPGLRALQELGIHSPLAAAGLDKTAIRVLAAQTGMDRPDQAARPCLLTRFAYGLDASPEALAALAEAEKAVESILSSTAEGACPDFRLRLVAGRPTQGRLPYETELHVAAELPGMVAAEALRRVVACGFAAPLLVRTEAVSGHYDRLQPATSRVPDPD